ncbi:hypothetical protein FB446DRAFT_728537 [Lentinula raphanica]|uniref:MADS-box domain-containing protein n=2 Tax=Lentinula TaxID=5352 RepID=A0AA38UIW4_9AGAR|nr:hypothetical protein FB446DRAFT_728537 [Lentinula raphanica]KAJ3823950.1 hypothetical protein F5880DRAFT_1563671 [Lentinula raphanica]KAJ3840047.1 hypothetical protein F5878DRAFT_89786 [Lentinula raphanica]
MGRRKIEIQPITHERNRSVTFLKRKHGLFKKAYELGVLCSVDVAVIIFEEKPGHNFKKLYQYCSCDVQDMVQRHIRHDGEKDTRGPADFAGGPSAKFEEFGEVEDDDLEDEEDARRGPKRIKPEDLSIDVDLGYVPATPSSLHGMSPNTQIPFDRHLHHQHSSIAPTKRARFGEGPPKSPRTAHAYNISPTNQVFSRVQHGSNAYNSSNFFSGPTTSPTSFHSDTNFNTVGHSSRDTRDGTSGTLSYPPRSTAYDAALYNPAIRQQHQPHSVGSGGNPSGHDVFKFLETDSRSRSSGSTGHLGTNIDWPDHTQPGYNSNNTVSNASHNASPENENTWLDFLSTSPTHGSHTPVSNAPDATGRRNPESLSWERGPGTRNSMSSSFTRTMSSAVNDGTRRSRLSSSGSAEDEASVSGGNGVPSGMGNARIPIKQEKDIGV